MSMEQLLDEVREFDGVLELAPVEGDDVPEIAWGDHFFYYSPSGVVPRGEQPYATVITKNYPGDEDCDLDPPDRWRLNVRVGRELVTELTGEDPRSGLAPRDLTRTDVVFGHPAYRALGWVSITNPGPATHDLALHLLRQAHQNATHRAQRPHR